MKMKISKAIEELRQDLDQVGEHKTAELRTAQRLGIEALKWRRHCEKVNAPEKYPLLPGETEEEPSSEE